MFNLFRSRETTVRILLGGLLFMVALSMLVYLIPGAGIPSSGSGGDNDVVAEVGGETLTARTVQQLIRDQIQNHQIPAEMIGYVVPELIDKRINDMAVTYEAKRLGLKISDADLAYTIRTLPNFANIPEDQYRMTVESMGMSVPEFESAMRENQYYNRVADLVQEGAVVTPQEVERAFKQRDEKAKIEYIAFNPQTIQAEVKPTDEQLRAYFAQRRAMFSIPETRAIRIVVADQERIGMAMHSSDAQLHQFYDANKDQFRTPERVKARHILLMTTGKPKADVDKLHKQAEDLLKQIKAGANFADLATKYSDDTASKVKGGDLGWVVRGQTVKNFENAAFSLKPNEISDVITTEYGFHIIQVFEHQDAHLQPFDEVKDQVALLIRKSTVNDRTQALADEARAEIAKAPQNAEQIANQLGLLFFKVDRVVPNGPIPGVGAAKNISQSVFAMKKGEVSQPLDAQNKLAIIILDQINAPRPAEFAEVEPQVRNRYTGDEAVRTVASRSKEAAEMLKSNGGDLKAVAKKFGLEVKTPDFFTRLGAVEGAGSASYFGQAFTLPIGSPLGPINLGTMTVVAKVVDRQSADLAKLAQEREAILSKLKATKAEESNQLYQDSILTKLTEEKKVKIHRDVIDRIVKSFRPS